jgi:hypothetical protein
LSSWGDRLLPRVETPPKPTAIPGGPTTERPWLGVMRGKHEPYRKAHSVPHPGRLRKVDRDGFALKNRGVRHGPSPRLRSARSGRKGGADLRQAGFLLPPDSLRGLMYPSHAPTYRPVRLEPLSRGRGEWDKRQAPPRLAPATSLRSPSEVSMSHPTANLLAARAGIP